MEKPSFGEIEEVDREESVDSLQSNESLENLEERIEVLQGIVDEFDSEISRVIMDFDNVASVSYSTEHGYDDSLKLKNLTNLVSKLSTFESHIKAMIDLFENKDGANGLNVLWSSIVGLREQLSVAPDIRYSREAQIEKYGGKENVPGEKVLDTFEHTQELIVSLQSQINGMKIALMFMNPTKILK